MRLPRKDATADPGESEDTLYLDFVKKIHNYKDADLRYIHVDLGTRIFPMYASTQSTHQTSWGMSCTRRRSSQARTFTFGTSVFQFFTMNVSFSR